jgi:predicted nucleotidyltransferase
MLFGSYAKGTATEQSDVDICFILKDYDDRIHLDILRKLYFLKRKYNTPFEPIVFETSDLHIGNPFVNEVLRTGVDLL